MLILIKYLRISVVEWCTWQVLLSNLTGVSSPPTVSLTTGGPSRLLVRCMDVLSSSQNSSVGRALDWRSKGPWFNPGFWQYFFSSFRLWYASVQVESAWSSKVQPCSGRGYKPQGNGRRNWKQHQSVSPFNAILLFDILCDVMRYRALLCTAPEFLRQGVCHPDHVGAGSIQGDVYRYTTEIEQC